MKNEKEAQEWKSIFGRTLKFAFSYYNLADTEFAAEKCDVSTIRKWKNGKAFPRTYLFKDLKEYISTKAKKQNKDDFYLVREVEDVFNEYGHGSTCIELEQDVPDSAEFIIRVLQYCLDAGRGNIVMSDEKNNECSSVGTTRVIVFDFDGTLTQSDKYAKTIWERLWISLGYNVKECRELHRKFDRKEITHKEWCDLTEKKFKEKKLHRGIVEEISKEIKLIDGVERIFRQLRKRDIKIYIVSGSIMLVIQNVLGNLYQYVDGIKANQFMFNEAGYLTRIIGTKYDFEGKSNYILKIANELKVSVKDILFIGNSHNDHFVYKSGARTLCINPQLTDATNSKIWNEYIETCEDLTEILEYI